MNMRENMKLKTFGASDHIKSVNLYMILDLYTSLGNPSGGTGRFINEERAETLLSAINHYSRSPEMLAQAEQTV